MGQKVSFNKNKTNKLKIIVILVIVILFIVILIKSFKELANSVDDTQSTPNRVGFNYTLNEFGSIEDVFKEYKCNLISKQDTKDLFSAKVEFSCNLYTDEKSNENFFLSLCKSVVEFENYKNIELIDTAKDIKIEVKCEGTSLTEIKINGDTNYYLNNTSRKSRNKKNKITNFTIQSKELKRLIDGNWDETKMTLGTRESMFDDYNIYFDEGYKYKVVDRKIFNFIFTSNYKDVVAADLTTNSSREKVEYALGEPTFDEDGCFGYRGKDNYIFFDFENKAISVYPVISMSEDDEKTLKKYIQEMNESHDIKTFATNLVNTWSDYDEYEFNSNYVKLKYSLKGIELSISPYSLKNGFFISQNYSGDRSLADMENVYLKETDAIATAEAARIGAELTKVYDAVVQGNENSELYVVGREDNGTKFVSTDESRADVELKDDIYNYKWISDSEIVYSITNVGIYYYDFNTFTKQKIIEGKEEFDIKSFENDILYYDDTSVKIER